MELAQKHVSAESSAASIYVLSVSRQCLEGGERRKLQTLTCSKIPQQNFEDDSMGVNEAVDRLMSPKIPGEYIHRRCRIFRREIALFEPLETSKTEEFAAHLAA
jgi:hypothetical protein